MPNSKQIVYLSQSQYAELIANGTITVNGVTVTYDENDIYVTPQAEPVTDVRINGTSIAANGVADIPVADRTVMGVGKVANDYGIQRGTSGLSDYLITAPADSSLIKSGNAGNKGTYKPLTPRYQHEATFYGLAKVAGHDEASSTESLGTYTPEAKGAIQQMLGVSDLIAPAENNLVASKAYKVGEVFTANGKLYKATVAIAADAAIIPAVEGEEVAGANCEETSVGDGFLKIDDYAIPNSKGGIVNITTAYGLNMDASHHLKVNIATDSTIKHGLTSGAMIVPERQHQAAFYGLAKAAGADEKDSTLPVGQYTDTAKAAIKSMIGVNVDDVQVNGTSVVSDGIAEIPRLGASGSGDYGVCRVNQSFGITQNGDSGYLILSQINDVTVKAGDNQYIALTPRYQHKAVFYGLAKAAGDTTQSSSTNAVGVYTDSAKASIKSMLGIVDGSTGTVDITGATPTINAVENTRYVCGEVTSLSFTPPSSGISIVRFTSGSTVTVLTIPNTVKFPEWFDPTALETNTIYEICVTDGEFGAVMSWAL